MNSIAFTIDETEYKLKVMFDKNKNIDYREYSFTTDCIKDSKLDYAKIFAQTLDLFVVQEDIYPATAICVLPDKYAFYDYVETPAVSGKRISDMLNLEINTRFKQKNLYKTVYVPMGSQNGKATSIAMMVQNEQIAAVNNALKAYKFASRSVTIESAMIANSFITLKPQDKRGAVLFAYIQDYETKVVVIKDSKLVCFTSIPYGKDLCDLQSKLKSAPPVLPTRKNYINNRTVFNCDEGGDPQTNFNYLLRTITEMCDIIANKYHIENITIKYNVPDAGAAALFAEYKDFERISAKSQIMAKYLQLYGGLAPKIYDKGLIF